MRLWTMQPVEVYDILVKDGVFRCDPAKIPEPSFADSYGWLMDQLDKKDKKPENVQLPIWAWFRFNKMEKKPDLRHSCYGPDEKIDIETCQKFCEGFWRVREPFSLKKVPAKKESINERRNAYGKNQRPVLCRRQSDCGRRGGGSPGFGDQGAFGKR